MKANRNGLVEHIFKRVIW